jgi:hypothetical protein
LEDTRHMVIEVIVKITHVCQKMICMS